MDGSSQILVLTTTASLGSLQEDPGGGALLPWPDGHWYRAQQAGDGVEYAIPPGTLGAGGAGAGGGGFSHLAAEFFLDGDEGAAWRIELVEADSAAAFSLTFGLLNQASARIRLPLAVASGGQGMLEREGAWLKPQVGGQRVDLAKVNRIRLTLERRGAQVVRWCMTPLTLWQKSPARLAQPLLPKGMLLDPLGQSTLRDWPSKTRSIDEVALRLREQSSSAINHKWPGEFSRHGGYVGGGAGGGQLESSGFFRTQHDGRRWWLVDPKGFLFWSMGLAGVNSDVVTPVPGLENALAWRPPAEGTFRAAHHGQPGEAGHGINFLAVNFIRAFGPQAWREHWWKITQAQLRMFGFNTVGNWSEWHPARVTGFPYVRALQASFPTTPLVFRDFPDVFHPNFARDAAGVAEQLRETLGDAALLGYFLMNEPEWCGGGGRAPECPAAGMLYHAAADCQTRKALAEFLRRRHGTDAGLAAAWGIETTYISIAFNEFRAALNETARADLAAFSAVMVEKYLKTLGEACRQVDRDHLNLGVRYPCLPPEWCVEGMKSCDVCSVNAYETRIPREGLEALSLRVGRPMLIGAWQFGALDVGLPASGRQRVASQKARGQAYQAYLEWAAASPACVGAHYFQMYDQSALGRYDGENYNIGFVDVCNQPYEELAWAARNSHERVYKVALGEIPAVEEIPEYLPPLCY